MHKNKIIFSTDSDFKNDKNAEVDSFLDTELLKVRIHLDRKKGGKGVTRIKKLVIHHDQLLNYSRELKIKCGVGGSIKNNSIILQGDQRDKAINFLENSGFKNVKKSGN